MIRYQEDDLLALSGIQHMAFCPRQWALIHIEGQWRENVLTIEGRFLHEKADNPYLVEKRRDLLVSRAMNLVSYELGLLGMADIVEFWRTEDNVDSVKIPGRQDRWRPKVVEYKRGRPKHLDCDKVQLCAQTMCLEEMLGIRITDGSLFYNATKHREDVSLDQRLRAHTQQLTGDMHILFASGRTPGAESMPACKSCSLKELCLPGLGTRNVANYLRKNLEED